MDTDPSPKVSKLKGLKKMGTICTEKSFNRDLKAEIDTEHINCIKPNEVCGDAKHRSILKNIILD